ncbi:MAG: right-handed parallel beta-helix repeat-containing protein, partial [Flavobacteriales bacterium]
MKPTTMELNNTSRRIIRWLLMSALILLPFLGWAQPVHNITSATDYLTIQAALSAANPYDIIEVDAGTYTEQLTITTPLTLRGAQHGVDPRPSVGSSRVISGPGESIVQQAKNKTVLTIKANDVVIDGLQFQQSGGSGLAHAIVNDNKYTGNAFRNNIITNITDAALRLYGGTGYVIEQNYLKTVSGDGIVLRNGNDQMTPATDQWIINNDLDGVNGVHGAIYVYGETDLEVAGNKITS